jgi:hypothetical protein
MNRGGIAVASDFGRSCAAIGTGGGESAPIPHNDSFMLIIELFIVEIIKHEARSL